MLPGLKTPLTCIRLYTTGPLKQKNGPAFSVDVTAVVLQEPIGCREKLQLRPGRYEKWCAKIFR